MQAPQHHLTFGCFRLDRDRRRLFSNGGAVALQGRAFDILEFLLDHRDRPVTRDEIVEAVWRGVNVSENNLAVQMSSLRRILAQYDSGELIITVPHRGYRFVGEVGPQSGAAETHIPPHGPGLLQHAMVNAPNLPRREAAWRHPRIAALAACAVLVTGFVAWHAAGPASGPAPTPVAFNPPPNSVAVLAFANLSGDQGQDYLSDGLSEELIEALSQIREVQVTARTSSFFFRGKPATIKDIAQALDVAAVVEGSVRRQGNHLRIEVRLTDARTGFELWSRPFDTNLGDLLTLERDIAARVAGALQVRLVAGDAADTAEGGTKSPEALDAYLRGVQNIRHDSMVGYHAALANFDAAVKTDPYFALAYAGKANALFLIFQLDQISDLAVSGKLGSEALAAANRGVELAPHLGLTQIARANLLMNNWHAMRSAWSEAVLAEALTPGNATVDLMFSGIAVLAGHMDAALTAIQRVLKLDPLREDAWLGLGELLRYERDYDGAFKAYQHAETLAGSETPMIGYGRALAFIALGKPQSAFAIGVKGSDWTHLECKAIAENALGRPRDAEHTLATLHDKVGENFSYVFAEVYAQWRRPADALRWLAKAKDHTDSGLTLIRFDPLMDPIRQEPGFKEIVANLDFPD